MAHNEADSFSVILIWLFCFRIFWSGKMTAIESPREKKDGAKVVKRAINIETEFFFTGRCFFYAAWTQTKFQQRRS